MKQISQIRFHMLFYLFIVYFLFYYILAIGILPSPFGLHYVFLFGSMIILIQLTRVYLDIVGGKA